ncbi:MAG: hypothetical protein F4Y90_07655 [Rhodothermaceae bacterium]|nr:hypothetical protein [Rhodothermaceae bacterium]
MVRYSSLWPMLVAIVWSGCVRVAPVVEEIPLAEPEPDAAPAFVAGPLPGVDSLVILDVVDNFDSTFVEAALEVQAQEWFLEGQQLVAHAESILTAITGPLALSDTSASGDLDEDAFVESVQLAREALTDAVQAQADQDRTLAQSLLETAQTRLEDAVVLNPRHEESRYQLAQVYAIRANYFQEQLAWEEALRLLRGLAALRANEHGLWAEMAVALGNLGRVSEAAIFWLRAAEIVLENTRLAFEEIPLDSAQVFTYSVRAYREFVQSRNGYGVHRALLQAHTYATSPDQTNYAEQELVWAQWDNMNLEHRIVFDSLRQAAPDTPLQVITELEALIPALTRPAARAEARYTHAILSYDNGSEDRALETLQELWQGASVDSTRSRISAAGDRLIQSPVPYPMFAEDLRQAYAALLFDRARIHRQNGSSGLAFTYLMQVTEFENAYTGKAYIEALRLARYNPQQALKLEPRIEAVFEALEHEDQLAYLQELGGLYRRIGELEKAQALIERFRASRDKVAN